MVHIKYIYAIIDDTIYVCKKQFAL